MASLTRPFPSMLRPDQGQNQKRNQESNATPGHPMTITQRDSYCLPPTPNTTREVGGTPNNTPAFHIVPIALRMGGGRPIGSGGGGGGSYAHAATPGNTPSSLETMGKRIAGRLQGGETPKGAGGGQGPSGGSSLGLGARIAPSYERRFTAGLHDVSNRLATHKEANAVDSPPDIQQLQLASPASGDGDKKSDWPTSFDTSTMGGSVPDVKQDKRVD